LLELITKSKIRRKIILLFIFNQDRPYYLSEIAHLVSTSPGTAQRELNKLIKFEFLLFEKKAGLNYYSLNQSYPLLEEVRSIVSKANGNGEIK